MNRTALVAALVVAGLVHAQGECKKERPLSKAELGFYERVKGSAKALPPAPKDRAVHPEEVTVPEKLCADVDPLFKKGQARFSVVTETEYRDPVDRTAKLDLAIKLGQPTAEEARKTAELTKKLEALGKQPADAGSAPAIVAAQAELLKVSAGQTERMNLAIHEAGLDAQSRVRVSFNPDSENTTGCGNQKTLVATKIDGAAQAFAGTCDVSSNPQESERGLLLLFGPWKVTAGPSTLEATSAFDAKKPHSAVQTVSVVISGDGSRPDELLKSLDVKALAALIGK
jgi:hypothetical protein